LLPKQSATNSDQAGVPAGVSAILSGAKNLPLLREVRSTTKQSVMSPPFFQEEGGCDFFLPFLPLAFVTFTWHKKIKQLVIL
jgi:hypothetical protein